jgi:hypothetical protein
MWSAMKKFELDNDKPVKISDYILTYLLIAFSGIPFFTGDNFIWPAAYIITVVMYFKRKGIKFNQFFIVYLTFIIIVLVMQTLILNHFDASTFMIVLLKFSYPYFTLKILGKKFLKSYIKVMCVIALISFLFYIPSILVPNFEEFLTGKVAPIFQQQARLASYYSYAPNFIVYTVNSRGNPFYRNSGPFWEPGGYACFLILALIFSIIKDGTFNLRKNLIFLISILTTFSTAGYIATLFLILGYLFASRRISALFLLIPIISILTFYSFKSFNFLGQKISLHIEAVTNYDINLLSRTRFVSMILDFRDIRDYPLVGKGRSLETRFGISAEDFTNLQHRSNGLTGLAVKYGIPFFLIYFLLVLRTFIKFTIWQRLPKLNAYVFLGVIFIIGFSQGLFEKPIFVSLVYLSVIISNELRPQKNGPPSLLYKYNSKDTDEKLTSAAHIIGGIYKPKYGWFKDTCFSAFPSFK